MECVCGLTGDTVTPVSPLYNKARREFNRAIQKFPVAIVYCHNKYDIANAVKWARRNNTPLRIRSGGHNFEGYSTGNGVLVIDVSFASADATKGLTCHLVQSSHYSLPLVLLVSPASSASLHPAQPALRLRSPRPSEAIF